jgi:hypothetical protein
MRSLHEAGDSLVAVAKLFDDRMVVLGSGVMVGPGFLITATHVLDEFSKEDPGPLFLTFLPHGTRAWLPTATSAASGQSAFDVNRKIVSDVSLVSCTLNSAAHEKFPLTLSSLKVEVPLVGSRVWAFGYREGNLEGDVSNITPLVSSGRVTAVFPHGRGERQPASCIEVEMEALGGMSGGPVLNEDGDLIGIVSSSFDGGPTYVSVIWEALRLSVESKLPFLDGRGAVRLFDLQNLGLVKIEGNVHSRGRDVILKMSEAETRVFTEALDPAVLAEAQAAGKRSFNDEEIEAFDDQWSSEIEELATRSALETLQQLKLQDVINYLAASEVDTSLLADAQEFSVEDFEGMGSREILGITRVDDNKLEIHFRFRLSTIIWTLHIPRERYLANKEYFDQTFINVDGQSEPTSMQYVQKCGFDTYILFDLSAEDFTEVRIANGFVVKERRVRKR